MAKKMKTMDGNAAAAYVSYAFTDVAAIFPITPSSPMAEIVDEMAAHGEKNLLGKKLKLSKCSPKVVLRERFTVRWLRVLLPVPIQLLKDCFSWFRTCIKLPENFFQAFFM